MTKTPVPTVQDRYAQVVSDGTLQQDPAQQKAAWALNSLYRQVISRPADGLVSRIMGKRTPVKGVYLHGPVGRGKSMLMQFFVDAVMQWNAAHPKKKNARIERRHFHEFMLDLHKQLFRQRVNPERLHNRLGELADDLAKRIDILCFDEFHVTDVADAMLLMPYFSQLWERGVVVVATSNVAPPDLYKDGLQRVRFLPFIDLLQNNMASLAVDGSQDYRQLHWDDNAGKKDHYITPLDHETEHVFADLFSSLVGYDTVQQQTVEVTSQDRVWEVPRASRHVAWLQIDSLLDRAVGAADFLALAEQFRVILLDGLKPFKSNENDRTKRFMLLIDTLYEAKTHVYVRADVSPADLYPYSHAKLSFEFARTVSRLQEMRYGKTGRV